jgi:hypothetical protein
MICQRIKLACSLFLIVCVPTSGQPLLQSWRKVESRLIERNSIASELSAFSLSINLISKEEGAVVQHFIDSLNNSIKHCKQLNKNYLVRIGGLNRKIEEMMSAQFSKIEESDLHSTSGNAVRLVALYSRAKEELYSSIEEYNKQVISKKRKDLVFLLFDK